RLTLSRPRVAAAGSRPPHHDESVPSGLLQSSADVWSPGRSRCLCRQRRPGPADSRPAGTIAQHRRKTMNESRQGAPPKMEPGSGNYWLFSLVALLVVVLGLLARGHVMWGLVLALVCAPGVVFRWRSAPVMLLLGVMLALTMQPTRPWLWAVSEGHPW